MSGLLIVGGGISLILRPEEAPAVVALGLVACVRPLGRAWRASRSTAIRPAIAWAAVALVLAGVGQVVGLAEPIEGGRPWCGHFVYVANLGMLAALISVYNARNPGGGAWAILMGMLVVVFLIPWLEGIGLAGRVGPMARLRLEAPWSWFFAGLAVAGAGNYLPTRYGPAAAMALAGLGIELIGLTSVIKSAPVRAGLWSGSAWALAAAICWAGRRVDRGRGGPGDDDLSRLWSTFRDHWGFVWAIRVAERFNRSAEQAGWPTRLGWAGPEPIGDAERAGSGPDGRSEAVELLSTLLGRFAGPEARARWSGRDRSPMIS